MPEPEDKVKSNPKEEELMLDIYFYKQEYEKANNEADKKLFKDRIESAENLYKELKNS